MSQSNLNRIITHRTNHNKNSTRSHQIPIYPICGLCMELIEVGEEVESSSRHAINHVNCVENSRM